MFGWPLSACTLLNHAGALESDSGSGSPPKLRATIHVAESSAEFDMFMHRRGPLYDWLKSQRSMSDCGQFHPFDTSKRCGLLSKNLLAAHVNYLCRWRRRIVGAPWSSVFTVPAATAISNMLRFRGKNWRKPESISP